MAFLRDLRPERGLARSARPIEARGELAGTDHRRSGELRVSARYLPPLFTDDLVAMPFPVTPTSHVAPTKIPFATSRVPRAPVGVAASTRAACVLAAYVLAACAFAACAQPIPVGAPSPANEPTRTQPTSTAPVRPRASSRPTPDSPSARPTLAQWPIKTAEHVDLWLHSFALVSEDTVRVPLYRRGYRDSMTVVKNRSNVLTSLDVNRGTLAKRLAASPNYLQAQFIAFEFPNWDAMHAAAEQFLARDAGSSRNGNGAVNPFAAIFPTAADREWLRLFITGVDDEQSRFFNAEHSRLVRSRSAVVTAVDSLWQQVYRARFQRFLTNTSQRNGDVLLSIPVAGEGRAGVGRDRQTVIAVPFPDRIADAKDVILVLAHELTGTLVNGVIAEHTTPAEQRAGTADRYVSLAQVRAGAMLLEKIAPELVDSYMRFYLAQSGVRANVADVKTLFSRIYDVPVVIRDGLQRQIDIVLGGI